MAITQEQISQIVPLLISDRARNFAQLQTYLRTILNNRHVDFTVIDGTGREVTISLSPQDAWSVISRWGKTSEANLPIGETGSLKTLAGRLLGYIETNIVGRTQEAAAARYAAIEQARTPIPVSPSPSQALDHFQKAQAKRQELFDAVNAKFLGKLTSEFEKSRYLALVRARTDAQTASMVAAFLAASSANLRQFQLDQLGNTNLPEKINETLLPLAGNLQTNNAIHLAYSQVAREIKALEELVEINNRQIAAVYASDQEYLADQEKLRDAAALAPTLSNLPALIDHLVPHATPAERQKMAQLLRQEIVKAASGQHQKGLDVLSQAFYQAKLAGNPSDLATLFPLIEEIEVATRRQILGATLRERDPRTLSTLNLACTTGVDPAAPWIRQQDIDAVQKSLLKDPEIKDPLVALDAEWRQPNPDIKKIVGLTTLLNNREQYRLYHQRLSDNPFLTIQNLFAKTNGSFKATTEPISRLYQKAWVGIEKIDNIVNWPTRTLVDGWQKIVEHPRLNIPLGKNGFKFALLDPAGSLYKAWINLQLSWAKNIGVWATGLAGSGRWYSGFFRQVSDFTSGFVNSNANWSQANFLFVEKKMG